MARHIGGKLPEQRRVGHFCRLGGIGCANQLRRPSQPTRAVGRAASSQCTESIGGRRTTNAGAASTGVWTLTVADLANGDSGSLNDWSLDIDCTATAPALSDLAVSVSGTTPPVAGDTVELTWTVTNQGPSATSNGRFTASLPTGLDDAMEDAAWGCSTSSGGSCTPDIACFGACVGTEIASSDPTSQWHCHDFRNGNADRARWRDTVEHWRSRVGPAGIERNTRPCSRRDQVQYVESVERHTDVAVTACQHAWQGQTVTVSATFTNSGPSLASGFGGQIDLPDGLVIQQFGCDRSPFACDLH